MKSYDKCIILDFDCTIGYFKQIVYLLNVIEKSYDVKLLKQSEYFEVFDCYPNILDQKFMIYLI